MDHRLKRLARRLWPRLPGGVRRVYIVGRARGFRRPLQAIRYLLRGRELDNFTYPIANRDELLGFVQRLTGATHERVAACFDELDSDAVLLGWLREKASRRSDRASQTYFGRRVVWYALARLMRPDIIVETGVHDGLGSAVLLRALDLNQKGRVVGMDIRGTSGWLIPDQLRDRFDLVVGPSLESIAHVGKRVDMFIHDSDHRHEYELAEYEAVEPNLGPESIIVSDNAHSTPALKEFASAHGWRFEYCREVSVQHWYPGGGVGIAMVD